MKATLLRHFVLPFLVAASPLLAANNFPQTTNDRPGYPGHARKSLERVKSAWETSRAASVSPIGDPTMSVEGAWAHLGVPELGGHMAIYDPLRDRMLVYGGDDNGTLNYDVWSLSMTDAHPWSKLAVVGTPPPSSGSAVYDPVRDRMIVLGGFSSLNDVFVLSLSGALEWTQIIPGGTKPAVIGPVVYDPVRDRLILSNGEASIWTLNLSGTPAWTEVVATGTPPGARTLPVSIYDPVRDRMLMWGGEVDDFLLAQETWELSLSGTPAWTQLTVTGTPPEGRVAATAIYDPSNDRMIVYGGTNFSPGNLRDAWSLSLAGTPAWTELTPPAPIPYQRSFHTAIYDAARERMVIFSGWGFRNGPPDRNDVWALALVGDPEWTPVPGTSPEPRSYHSAIYDPVGDRMVIFGGGDFSERNDVWSCSLDERPTWTELHPAGELPPPTSGATAVYDRSRERMIVLFGSDVWALSLRGTLKWTHLAPKGTPPSDIHSAIYDAKHHRVVALTEPDNEAWTLSLSGSPKWSPMDATSDQPVPGGSIAIYDRKRDRLLIWGETSNEELWALPLSGHPEWTRIPTTGPAPADRTGYSLIYDPTRDQLVLFRGYQNAGDGQTPWALPLTGSGAMTWQVLTTAGGNPYTEDGHSAIYDPVRDRMVVFGGRYFYNSFNEAWTLSFGPASPIYTYAPVSRTGLQPCYPNPFNPSVTIPFELQRAGKATLSIFDVSGRLVTTLVDEWTSRGTHTATWNGTGAKGDPVASGIYFARLRVDALVQTRKLVMLK